MDNDPFIIAECLARPLLAERLSRSLYASDERFHGELKRQAEAELSQTDAPAQMRQMSGEYREMEWRLASGESETPQSEIQNLKSVGVLDGEEWRGQLNKLARMFGNDERGVMNDQRIGPQFINQHSSFSIPLGLSTLQEDEGRFYAPVVVEQEPNRVKLASVEWKKVSFDDWWSAVQAEMASELAAPRFGYRLPEIGAVAVLNEGGTGALTDGNAPSARYVHTAVWTGSEMIVWGGTDDSSYFNTGGRYAPATNTWTATNSTGAPSGRTSHAAVWMGSEMIVWGGL